MAKKKTAKKRTGKARKKTTSSTTQRRSTRKKTSVRSGPGKRKKTRSKNKRAVVGHEEVIQQPRPLTGEEVELALASGSHRADLEAMFGIEDYTELQELAQAANRRMLRTGAPLVLILPGILGSKLGNKRKFPGLEIGYDDLWFDPAEIVRGNLVELNPARNRNLEAHGVMLSFYLKLKLRLKANGFRVKYYAYDWRLGLDTLGKALASHIEKNFSSDKQVSIVAHSMGGLVSRAATALLKNKADTIDKVIMLGTPNHGSYVPVQIYRGVSPTLLKVAKLDPFHDADELVEEVFSTMDGLIQMLPFDGTQSGIDFFSRSAWPSDKSHPQFTRLRKHKGVRKLLESIPADTLEKFYLVAGVNKDTVVDASIVDDQYVFESSNAGDGTVPLFSARLPGIAATYYVEENHGALPNNRTVAKAAVDLLKKGVTDELPSTWASTRSDVNVIRSEIQLEEFDTGLKEGELPGHQEKLMLLREFLAPSSETRESRANLSQMHGLDSLSSKPVIIGRKRQSRLDLTMALGDITTVNSPAIILGIYEGVEPGGAARALDRALSGEIRQVVARRLFSARAGEVFVLPVSRKALAADFIVFVGLGYYDEFTEDVLRMASKNAARMLIAAQIDEFATVMIGSGSATTMASSVSCMLQGFYSALSESSGGRGIRAVTVVEYDEVRFQQMMRTVVELGVSDLLDGVELTIESMRLPTINHLASRVPLSLLGDIEPIYLIVRESAQILDDDQRSLFTSLLTSGGKATVISETIEYSMADLDSLLSKIDTITGLKGIQDFGVKLGEMVLPAALRQLLNEIQSNDVPVVVLHDPGASKIPWETIHLRTSAEPWSITLRGGLSRKVMTDIPVSKWLESRITAEVLSILLVVDPTNDLQGAVDEGNRIKRLLQGNPSIALTEVWQSDATHGRVFEELSSGLYDIVHYAGHAFFDPVNRSRSGLVCAGGRVLSGEHLSGLGNLPTLLFFNACEAGRLRARDYRSGQSSEFVPRKGVERVLRNVSLSEAFLRGGIANYIGTYWPVGDAPAEVFAKVFYKQLLNGDAIGKSIDAARKAVYQSNSKDWADYMHYGEYGFKLKVPNRQG